jgi:putative mycofactocin binding protein MftB
VRRLLTAVAPGTALDLDAAWDLHPQVAVRPEPFGALLYHFGSRRLSFLKDPVLLTVLEDLPARTSLRSSCEAAGLPSPPPAHVTAALATLAATGMIVRRADP